jgi:hypothetical protein
MMRSWEVEHGHFFDNKAAIRYLNTSFFYVDLKKISLTYKEK